MICRPSHHTVGRPWAEIRTQAGWPRGRDTTPRPPCLLLGITPGDQPTIRNYTLTHTPKMAWSGGYQPPPPPPEGSAQIEETKGSTRQALKEGRRGCPALSLKLSDSGFSSLADKRRLDAWSTGAVRPCGYCHGHLNSHPSRYLECCRSRACSARSRTAVWSYSVGDLWIGGS